MDKTKTTNGAVPAAGRENQIRPKLNPEKGIHMEERMQQTSTIRQTLSKRPEYRPNLEHEGHHMSRRQTKLTPPLKSERLP